MHARRHQREEKGRGKITGDGPYENIPGQAGLAEKPDDASRGIAEQRHDKDNIGRHTQKHGEQRREDHVDGFGHDGTDRLFHIGDQKRTDNNRQNAAFPAVQNRLERNLTVIQAQDGRDRVDAAHARKHAEHTAEDGRAAEAFRSAIPGPGGQIGHHGGVDQREDLVDEGPDVVVLIVRYHLGDEGHGPSAEPGTDDAGKQRNKNVADHSQNIFHLVSFHRSGLL